METELCSYSEEWYFRLMDFEPASPPSIMLCDNVVVEQGTQKLTLVGCFHAFNGLQFPFQTPRFFVAASIGNLRGIPAEIDITIRIEVAQNALSVGSSSIRIKGDFAKVAQFPDSVIQVPIAVGPLLLPQPGLYKAVLLVNGEPVAIREFRVHSITTNSQQA